MAAANAGTLPLGTALALAAPPVALGCGTDPGLSVADAPGMPGAAVALATLGAEVAGEGWPPVTVEEAT